MDILASESPLIVYIDVKSPYAFVAINPTLKLEKELGLKFDWRPLTLNIPSYLGSARKKDGKVVSSSQRSERLWKGIRYSYADARRYAERQGLALKGTEKIWNSSIANIAIFWAMQEDRDKIGDYLQSVYLPFWRRELNIEDASVVETCLKEAGVRTEGFAEFLAGQGRVQHDAMQGQFHHHGIYGVPTYVFDRNILFGREHIPYIRWHLTGRHGPAPDIAYELD